MVWPVTAPECVLAGARRARVILWRDRQRCRPALLVALRCVLVVRVRYRPLLEWVSATRLRLLRHLRGVREDEPDISNRMSRL